MKFATTIAFFALATSSLAATCFSDYLCTRVQAENIECAPPNNSCGGYANQVVDQLYEEADKLEADGSTDAIFAAGRKGALAKELACWFDAGGERCLK